MFKSISCLRESENSSLVYKNWYFFPSSLLILYRVLGLHVFIRCHMWTPLDVSVSLFASCCCTVPSSGLEKGTLMNYISAMLSKCFESQSVYCLTCCRRPSFLKSPKLLPLRSLGSMCYFLTLMLTATMPRFPLQMPWKKLSAVRSSENKCNVSGLFY